MSPWRRSPRPLGTPLATLQDRLAPAGLLAEVQRVWPQAVGAAVADQASPVSERGGVLTVSCAASVWAQELELMAPAITERLNGLLSAGRVVRLRCVSVPPRG